MAEMKQYPDHTLEKALRERGLTVRCMWQMKGPPNTAIAWLECLAVNNQVVIVETFKGAGWEAFVAEGGISVGGTVEAVATKCAKPEVARGVLAALQAIKAVDDKLNKEEACPDGDSYNDVVGFALHALELMGG